MRFSFLEYARHVFTNWDDVLEKARRLIAQNKVNIKVNRPEMIHGVVEGDHGDYDVSISREDPNSLAVTQWQCGCPWSQFSWGRTRKWKYLEGRPCSHATALMWKSLATPLDVDDAANYQFAPGQKRPPEAYQAPGQQQIPGMPAPEELQEQAPQSMDDLTLPAQPPQFGQKFDKQPVIKSPRQVIPQHQQMHLYDVTAPPGSENIVPAPVTSVPGGRPPTPGSPVQLPGALSNVAASQYDPDNWWDQEHEHDPNYVYHLAPTAERDRIQSHGLQPSKPMYSPHWGTQEIDEHGAPMLRKQPEGVYTMSNIDQLKDLGRSLYPAGTLMDIWRIPYNDIHESEEDPIFPDYGTVIKHPVFPELHEPYEINNFRPPEYDPTHDTLDRIRNRGLPTNWGIGFPDRVLGQVQNFRVVRSNFVWYTASDFEMRMQEMLQNGVAPVMQLVRPAELEQRGGKIPAPGAMPIGITKDGLPKYNIMDLGWDPETQTRINADETNPLGPGAPEQRGVTGLAHAGTRGILMDLEPVTKQMKVMIPLHDSGPLHPHSLVGWMDYKDARHIPNAPNPYERGRRGRWEELDT